MKNLSHLEQIIHISFRHKDLLKNAFIHRSYLNENSTGNLSSNEKLEFLGDSVLSLITSMYLYTTYPHLHEGVYTDIKSSIVKTESLYEAAKKLELNLYLYLSKGEEKNKGKYNKSILADCFEALIASIFLDQGFEASNRFVMEFLFGTHLDHIITHRLYLSPKNRLQEYWQNKYKKLPQYIVLDRTGPEHKKHYSVAILIDAKHIGKGEGKSIKKAEEKAALDALQKIGV
ncbi:MAG TPA: ribonuclease III [Patescibacteria group bacterium]|nr:ribonuclease III [Patescibacteria group bacterium]